MPLVLEMKAGDKVIINGAVVELFSHHAKLIVHNQASILRGKEVLTDEESATPAGRVYFALQNAYMFPEHQEGYLKQFNTFLSQYLESCPSAAEIVEKVRKEVDAGKLYKGLKAAQDLIMHQHGVLTQFEKQLEALGGEEEENG